MLYLVSLCIECLANLGSRCKRILQNGRELATEGDVRCTNCGYPVRQSVRWQVSSCRADLRCRACDSPLAFDETGSLAS